MRAFIPGGIRRDGGGWRLVALRWLAYGPASLVDGIVVTLTFGRVQPCLADVLITRAIEAQLSNFRARRASKEG